MVEERIYYRVWESIAGGQDIWESSEWTCAVLGVGAGEPGAAARRPKVQRGLVTKLVGLSREGRPNPWTKEFRVEGGVYLPGRPCNQ